MHVNHRAGRLPLLMAGIAGYLVTAFAGMHVTTIQHLFVAMIPSAFLGQTFGNFQALLTDFAIEHSVRRSERVGYVGLLGMSAGMAFIFGPVEHKLYLKYKIKMVQHLESSIKKF